MHSIDRSGWRGELALRYEYRDERTVLVSRRHAGPVLVQKSLYPEGDAVCHGIVLHPPGGIVGGDRLEVATSVGPRASALLTTPGASKWYRSAGARAEQRLSFTIAPGASLEWLPQASIAFNGVRGRTRTRIDVDPAGSYIGWDVLCLGRTAADERFTEGELMTDMRIVSNGKPIWIERGRIEGGSRLLDSPAGLAGQPVYGSLVAVSTLVNAALVSECRKAQPASGCAGVTRLPGLLLARYLGDRADVAHDYFVRIWQVLRPALLGRPAALPRIWRT